MVPGTVVTLVLIVAMLLLETVLLNAAWFHTVFFFSL